tara:strand:+ start:1838 stop:2059 length:222 start_codon:yes stop_codon:yes gene_type:complete
MKTAKEKNLEINNIQKEKDKMGANDKLYNDSMSKDAEKEAVAPNTKISRAKIEGNMSVLDFRKASTYRQLLSR